VVSVIFQESAVKIVAVQAMPAVAHDAKAEVAKDANESKNN
jgi:hypothetical protein